MERVEYKADPLDILVEKGYLVQVDAADPLYSPARDPETVTLAEVLHSFREGSTGRIASQSGTDSVMEVLVSVNKAIDHALQGLSLKQWVLANSHTVTPALDN